MPEPVTPPAIGRTAREVVEPPPVGSASKPSFLDLWGVIFLACAGGWILLVGSAMLIYYFRTQPALPTVSGLNPDQIRNVLNVHQELLAQWRDSLTSIFDLLVTKTVLPIVTLLLGYLFGKARRSE